MALGMVAFTITYSQTQSLALALAACLLAGLIAGLLNGLIVVRMGIPSLVVTLGTQFFWRGVVNVVTAGNGSGLSATRGTLLYDALVGRIGGLIPAQMVWTVLLALLMWFSWL
jgi:simple sugar transport system permease protein